MTLSVSSGSSPLAIVILSTFTYSAILRLLLSQGQSHQSNRILIKAISATHSVLATGLTIWSLYQPWHTGSTSHQRKTSSHDNENIPFDDSQNPLISGRSSIANFVTAWETGYLIYDTGALLLESYWKDTSRVLSSAVIRLFRRSPFVVAHHTALVAALLWLQAYIAAGREKGMKIIMMFFMMNASTPLLHLRWWRRKVTGRSDTRIDTALLLLFAATRFGLVYRVMDLYGQYHNLRPWQAFRMQRVPCQAGTGLLTSLNAVWWLGLLRQVVQKKVRKI